MSFSILLPLLVVPTPSLLTSSPLATLSICAVFSILPLTLYRNYPLRSIGNPPSSSAGCVWGYDSVRGDSPLLSRLVYSGAKAPLNSLSLLLPTTLLYILPIFLALLLLPRPQRALAFAALYFLLRRVNGEAETVSRPEGPRSEDNTIQREGLWSQSDPEEDGLNGGRGWECVTCMRSHEATQSKFKDEDILTGESVGRATWRYNAGLKNNRIHPDVHRGKEGNVNSSDIIYRSQVLHTKDKEKETRHKTSSSEKGKSKSKGKGKMNNKKSSDSSRSSDTIDAFNNAALFYSRLQSPSGCWFGDYGGPLFLMQGLIIVWHLMGRPASMLSPPHVASMTSYLLCHQQTDGGWGSHIESPSTMFGTTMSYVALRLLSLPKDHPKIVQARSFIHSHGGATHTASWCKFYLALLGVTPWDAVNPIPPEMWLLPDFFPFHPSRMWCHARMVYLPMGFLYGQSPETPLSPVVLSLQEELYENHSQIDWGKTRHLVAPIDNYSPVPFTMRLLQDCLQAYEKSVVLSPLRSFLRERGRKFSADYMRAEDEQTNYIDIGPVNKVLNMFSSYRLCGGDISAVTVKKHIARVEDYLWVAEDGMKMQGYNGSQCWDTSFCLQAMLGGGIVGTGGDDDDGDDDNYDNQAKFNDVLKRGYSFLYKTQILSTPTSSETLANSYESPGGRARYYRHISRGGWPFSTSAHGWPISDCTGEGLKAVISLLRSPPVLAAIEDGSLPDIRSGSNARLKEAVDVILALQNADGGFATYENNRGYGWYEKLNPSEVFGDIMIDYSYVECSMSSITALVDFREEVDEEYRRGEIDDAVRRCGQFMKRIQRDDGSFYGSWACCFTYGCWFGVEGLVAAGFNTDQPEIVKCCEVSVDGRWGCVGVGCIDKKKSICGVCCVVLCCVVLCCVVCMRGLFLAPAEPICDARQRDNL